MPEEREGGNRLAAGANGGMVEWTIQSTLVVRRYVSGLESKPK
jgi:hypothetical protein